MKFLKQRNLKVISAIVWSLFTGALIIWWWILTLKLSAGDSEKHRMIMYEGATLVTIFCIGSIVLITYVWRDHIRNEKLKLFFSIFTHDIKTSISRLRLQAEILDEGSATSPDIHRLAKDVMRLDLQLENSLNFAHLDQTKFYLQKTSLSTLISNVKSEFPDLTIQLQTDAEFQTDKKIFSSILRNILRNAEIHGKASNIKINVIPKGSLLEIRLQDNGVGFTGETSELGKYFKQSKSKLSNGFGLYLSKQLIRKLKGQIHFESPSEGFLVCIQIPGRVL